jgi:anthranilate synthase component 1
MLSGVANCLAMSAATTELTALPSLTEFLAQASWRAKESGCAPHRVHLVKDILADIETPVTAYWKLAHDQTYSFLLESVTGGEQVSRYSFIGVRPRSVVRSQHGKFSIDGVEQDIPAGQDPLHVLEASLNHDPIAPTEGLPHFSGGAVGMMAYDLVRWFEHLPSLAKDELNVPDLSMLLVDTVVAFDHAKNRIRIIHLAEGTEAGYQAGVTEIEWISDRLRRELPPLPKGSFPSLEPVSNVGQEKFESMVTKMVEYISLGDGVQMVPSQRFSVPIQAHPLTVYRALRSINPSPYMFLLRLEELDVVGASPELLSSLHGRTARVRPIAGTRWRGKSEAEDLALETELLADEKERAEHVMLVDLGRNDLGRVCDFGSVSVNELMVIERYSHVMHIVSDVTGTLSPGKSAYDLIRATFPAGTVSGAPKVRAMQIIEELEPSRRGLYAGAVGYFSHNGNMDTAIALRTILLKDGIAYVQAGGGVVYDSDPTKEFVESGNKAKAALSALRLAQSGL